MIKPVHSSLETASSLFYQRYSKYTEYIAICYSYFGFCKRKFHQKRKSIIFVKKIQFHWKLFTDIPSLSLFYRSTHTNKRNIYEKLLRAKLIATRQMFYSNKGIILISSNRRDSLLILEAPRNSGNNLTQLQLFNVSINYYRMYMCIGLRECICCTEILRVPRLVKQRRNIHLWCDR